MKDQLYDPTTSHIFGDSKDKAASEQFENFLNKLDAILDNKLEATIVLDDPCGNSYIQVGKTPLSKMKLQLRLIFRA